MAAGATARRGALFAGAQVFFDAEHSCPPHFCPASREDYKSACAIDGHPFLRHQRQTNKPIVVPRRVRDLGTHGATPAADAALVRLWRPCLQHA